jgi:hypothetical protein
MKYEAALLVYFSVPCLFVPLIITQFGPPKYCRSVTLQDFCCQHMQRP